MITLDEKDTLSMIQTDLQGLASLLLSHAEAQNLYNLPAQFELFSHILEHAADQLQKIIDD